MKVKSLIIVMFLAVESVAPLTGVPAAWAKVSKAACMNKALKQKQLAQLACHKLGGKKKTACVQKAISNYSAAIKLCK